jgi:small subunit ribosomal protein S16
MSLVIRLMRIGKKGERKFRIAVQEKRSRRDGNSVEQLGTVEKGKNGMKDVDKKRYAYWISQGAEPSLTVQDIMK